MELGFRDVAETAGGHGAVEGAGVDLGEFGDGAVGAGEAVEAGGEGGVLGVHGVGGRAGEEFGAVDVFIDAAVEGGGGGHVAGYEEGGGVVSVDEVEELVVDVAVVGLGGREDDFVVVDFLPLVDVVGLRGVHADPDGPRGLDSEVSEAADDGDRGLGLCGYCGPGGLVVGGVGHEELERGRGGGGALGGGDSRVGLGLETGVEGDVDGYGGAVLPFCVAVVVPPAEFVSRIEVAEEVGGLKDPVVDVAELEIVASRYAISEAAHYGGVSSPHPQALPLRPLLVLPLPVAVAASPVSLLAAYTRTARQVRGKPAIQRNPYSHAGTAVKRVRRPRERNEEQH